MRLNTHIQAHLVVSEVGLNDLCSAGITTGWLSAWLQSAGAERVELHLLESDTWKQAADWQMFYASESELLPLGDISYQRERWLHILNADRPLLPLHVYPGDHGGIALEPGLHGLLRANPDEPEGPMNDGGYLPEETLSYKLKSCGLKVRFAESCTGGGLSERLSRVPCSSEVLDAAWITYSNDAKHALLKVPKRLLTKYGAVSHEVVEVMAQAGCDKTHACVAVSGIAGPDGGSEDKPVGTVWMAAALPGGKTRVQCSHFSGSRAMIRQKTVNHAFALLAGLL